MLVINQKWLERFSRILKANDLEPYDYLLMVLSLLPREGKSPSHETLERLMPWYPNVQGCEILSAYAGPKVHLNRW